MGRHTHKRNETPVQRQERIKTNITPLTYRQQLAREILNHNVALGISFLNREGMAYGRTKV